MQPNAVSWFRNTALYQIYPRSFYDSDGDGVGDLRGIIQKLKYLKGEDDSLGIGAIWISPFYPSPLADFGYDVSDYCNVDPLFGTLEDFKQLLDEAHLRGIKVLIDFIPNHTSEQHPWFKEALVSRDNPHRDWYVWRDPKEDGSAPNNWLSVFGGSAWKFDELSGQYYLHSFLKEQPDLNWENPELRAAMKQVLRFWLDLGVDGFRADAVYWMAKDPEFRDDPINHGYQAGSDPYDKLKHLNSKEAPKLTRYLNEIAETLKEYNEKFMIVEASPESFNITNSYMNLYRELDPSVCAPFNFEGMTTPWQAKAFRAFIDDFQAKMLSDYVPVYCMGNHDKPRLRHRLGLRSARTAAVMQLTLPGFPVIYQGDEIGMAGSEIGPEFVQDPFGKRVPGMGRDGSRTPFLWNSSTNAGFSSSTKTWLPVDPDYLRQNLEAQLHDPDSFYSLYRRLIRLRNTTPALQHGSYESFDVHSDVYAYLRGLGGHRVAVLLNFSDEEIDLSLPIINGRVLLSTHPSKTNTIVKHQMVLHGNEALVIELETVY